MNRKLLGTSLAMAICLSAASLEASADSASPQLPVGPTVESVIALEHTYAKAYVDGDADALGRLLSDDWEVVSSNGGWGKGKKPVMDVVRSRQWTHTVLDVSDIKVRLYGNVAVTTEHLTTSGVLMGKAFNDIKEVETDIFVWGDGMWKCVLTHETKIKT